MAKSPRSRWLCRNIRALLYNVYYQHFPMIGDDFERTKKLTARAADSSAVIGVVTSLGASVLAEARSSSLIHQLDLQMSSLRGHCRIRRRTGVLEIQVQLLCIREAKPLRNQCLAFCLFHREGETAQKSASGSTRSLQSPSASSARPRKRRGKMGYRLRPNLRRAL